MAELTSKLTKRAKNYRTGEEEVQCAVHGKAFCRKRRYRCQGCPVFKGILQELEALEDFYIEHC